MLFFNVLVTLMPWDQLIAVKAARPKSALMSGVRRARRVSLSEDGAIWNCYVISENEAKIRIEGDY